MGLKLSEEDQDLPYLYWTPKLHKTPFKHRFIAGSSKCRTKELSCLLTKILTTIKDGLSRYCTKMSHNRVNNMWILKNSTSLLSSLEKFDVRYANSVQTFDFSTLYTSIPHDLLKSRISTLIRNSLKKKDGSSRYTYITLDKVYRAMTVDTEPWRWIPSHDGGVSWATMVDTEPQRWIPSHDGGVSWTTTADTEPRRWGIMSHDGGVPWATTVGYHEPRWWIPSHDGGVSWATTVGYHEPRRWGIMSHDGGVPWATTVGYHEPRWWIPSHDGGVSWATTVGYHEPRRWGIMSHNGGYRATTVEYHEPRRSIPSHDGGVSWAMTVEYHEPWQWSIMSHDSGYRATTVEYHKIGNFREGKYETSEIDNLGKI